MTAPRAYSDVADEQLAAAAQAVSQAGAANDGQQQQAERWFDAGLPADMGAHQPGPHQHE